MFSTLVVVIGCRKCSNEPGMSCSCKLFAVHLLFDVITEQINNNDDDDDDDDFTNNLTEIIMLANKTTRVKLQ